MNRRTFLRNLGTAVASPLITQVLACAASQSAVPTTPTAARPFISRLQPAVAGGGFELPDHWVWCGAPIRGEEGRYHLFASRVSKDIAFHPHWLFCSEIVRAESDTPVGPYRFAEVALPPRGGDFFDARSTHNPHIRKVGDTYLLLYMGTNYDGPTPTRQNPEVWRSPRYLATWARKRIGLATSKSVRGPWKRLDTPLLEPRPGEWDSIATTNPSLCPLPDGSFLLAYKARKENLGNLQVGVAHAPHFAGPWKRQRTPWLFRGKPTHVEDPYLWYEDGRVHALMKDMTGEICGEQFAGVHVTSADGLNWDFDHATLAYTRKVRWSDGRTTQQAFLERPQLLIEQGVPTHLFCATAEGGSKDLKDATRTWNIVFPLAK
ncbi:MAG: glycoside hydrolase family protein [Bacillota bacterium]